MSEKLRNFHLRLNQLLLPTNVLLQRVTAGFYFSLLAGRPPVALFPLNSTIEVYYRQQQELANQHFASLQSLADTVAAVDAVTVTVAVAPVPVESVAVAALVAPAVAVADVKVAVDAAAFVIAALATVAVAFVAFAAAVVAVVVAAAAAAAVVFVVVAAPAFYSVLPE